MSFYDKDWYAPGSRAIDATLVKLKHCPVCDKTPHFQGDRRGEGYLADGRQCPGCLGFGYVTLGLAPTDSAR